MMTLDPCRILPCRILPGRRTLSRDQALAAIDQAGDRGLSSRELALRVALPIDRVRRVLRVLQGAGDVVLRWSGDAARWFRAEGRI